MGLSNENKTSKVGRPLGPQLKVLQILMGSLYQIRKNKGCIFKQNSIPTLSTIIILIDIHKIIGISD